MNLPKDCVPFPYLKSQEERMRLAMASPGAKVLNAVALGRGETPRSTRKAVRNISMSHAASLLNIIANNVSYTPCRTKVITNLHRERFTIFLKQLSNVQPII